jgi:predicted Rossmann fold nucleotide-binding protein DprA/Smf involved in DNA uptake
MDVLSFFGLEPTPPLSSAPTGPQAVVLECLQRGPLSADEVSRATGLEAGTLAAALTALELAGLVIADDGVYRSSIGV